MDLEDIRAFSEGTWHPNVKTQLEKLQKAGKLNVDALNKETLSALQTLQFDVAHAVCLKIENSETVADMDTFVLTQCKEFEELWTPDRCKARMFAGGKTEEEVALQLALLEEREKVRRRGRYARKGGAPGKGGAARKGGAAGKGDEKSDHESVDKHYVRGPDGRTRQEVYAGKGKEQAGDDVVVISDSDSDSDSD